MSKPKIKKLTKEVRGFTDYDLERLQEWILDDNRKLSSTAFTSGVARNISSLIEVKFLKK